MSSSSSSSRKKSSSGTTNNSKRGRKLRSVEEEAEDIIRNTQRGLEEIQEQERQEAEERRREEERIREEARIKQAGDDYVRSNAWYYNQLQSEAYWQGTVGKEIVSEKTALENYITPGVRIIESEQDSVSTRTNKSGFSERLKEVRSRSVGLSSNMVFVPLNARANDYLNDVVQNSFRPAYYQYDNFVRMDMSAGGSSTTQRIYQWLDATGAWADARRKDAGDAVLGVSVKFCTSVAKSTISGISAMSNQVMRVYERITNVGDVFNTEKGMINESLDYILKNWNKDDYDALGFINKQKEQAKETAKEVIYDQTDATPSKKIYSASSSWFINLAKGQY